MTRAGTLSSLRIRALPYAKRRLGSVGRNTPAYALRTAKSSGRIHCVCSVFLVVGCCLYWSLRLAADYFAQIERPKRQRKGIQPLRSKSNGNLGRNQTCSLSNATVTPQQPWRSQESPKLGPWRSSHFPVCYKDGWLQFYLRNSNCFRIPLA
jgi:hypothetical protein